MKLFPKDYKFRKIRKGKLKKVRCKNNNGLKFGNFGLKAGSAGCISAKQLESARQAISRKIKKQGKLWVRVFPDLPVTKKPSEVRMGKGSGKISKWVVKVSCGTVLFETYSPSIELVMEAFKTGGAKIPLKTIIFNY